MTLMTLNLSLSLLALFLGSVPSHADSCKSFFYKELQISEFGRLRLLEDELSLFLGEKKDLLQTLKELVALEVKILAAKSELENVKNSFDILNKTIRKSGINPSLTAKVTSALEQHEQVLKKLMDIKIKLEIFDRLLTEYKMNDQYRADLNFLIETRLKFAEIPSGRSSAERIRILLETEFKSINEVDTLIDSIQKRQENLFLDSTLANISKHKLLLTLRPLINIFDKYGNFDKPLDPLILESIPAASGDYSRYPQHEIAVVETLFGFKILYVSKGMPTAYKFGPIALLDPSINLRGYSRGQFFRHKSYLYGVVGIFRDGKNALVERISPQGKMKLKKISFDTLDTYETMHTSNLTRPLLFGDTFYLKSPDHIYSKTVRGYKGYRLLRYEFELALNPAPLIYKEDIDHLIVQPAIAFAKVTPYVLVTTALVVNGILNPAFLIASVPGPIYKYYLFKGGTKISNFREFIEVATDTSHTKYNDYQSLTRSSYLFLGVEQFSLTEKSQLPPNTSGVDSHSQTFDW